MTTVDLDLVKYREQIFVALIDYHKSALVEVVRVTRELSTLLTGHPGDADDMIAELDAIANRVEADAERILSEQIPLQ